MAQNKRIVLITGANSGIGLAAAKIIAASSADNHIIVAARSQEKGTQAIKDLESQVTSGSTFSFLSLDVTSEDSIKAAAAKIAGEYGYIDVLINNAGIHKNGDNKDITAQSVTDVLVANTVGPIIVSEHFNPLLLKSKYSKGKYSIFVSSGLGSIGYAADFSNPYSFYTGDPYRVSKSALNAFMVQQHRFLKDQGVKVFAVCPGLVRSNLRGTDEESISAGGRAISADTSGEFFLGILEGKRDKDVGSFINDAGTLPW